MTEQLLTYLSEQRHRKNVFENSLRILDIWRDKNPGPGAVQVSKTKLVLRSCVLYKVHPVSAEFFFAMK